MDLKSLLKQMELTRGRIRARSVFQDFIALTAYLISNIFDPVHLDERTEQIGLILKNYSPAEQTQLMETFYELHLHYLEATNKGKISDLLGHAYFELGLAGKMGQDFSPSSIADIMVHLAFPDETKLPEQGFFTIMEPACGSGILALSISQRIKNIGFNPCQDMVIQATDIDLRCVYMTYVQLSLQGIPAVVIHGDTLTLKEYSRWYTPAYILGKWVWRCPMPFSGGRSWSDELLKMADEPIYGALRAMEWGLLGEKKQGGAAG